MHPSSLPFPLLHYAALSKKPSSHPALKDGIHYDVLFKGLENNPALLELFQETSQLVALEKSPPASLEGLRSRTFDDIPHLIKALESEGYYDGQIFPFLQGGLYVAVRGAFQVILEVALGTRYTFGFLKFLPSTPQPSLEDLFTNIQAFGIKLNQPARAEIISKAITTLISQLATRGYPFAEVKSQSIVVHEDTYTLDAETIIEIGPLARFGPVSIEGLKTLEESYILDEIPWEKSALFDAKKIDALRTALLESNLFTSVEILPHTILNSEGELPILIRVKENKRYYIGTGLHYSSSEGGAIKAFWGDRNLLGGGEKLNISAQKGRIRSDVETTYTIPHFLRKDQDLVTSLEGISEHPEAYKKNGVSSLFQVHRKINERWQSSLGFEYSLSRIKKSGLTETYNLPSLPFNVTYSTVNSILNPTKGFKGDWSFVPFPELLGGNSNFARISLKQLLHEPLDVDATSVFSTYMNVGLMPNGGRRSVPPDRLFYAGGGSSVRGYGYQLAGPLDSNNDPLGGASSFEAGVELLTKVSEEVGVVSFVDAGTVYKNPLPSFSTSLFWGVGGGVRYYTPVGPLRFDIAFPLRRRSGVDSAFQLYAGIGQSF